MPETPAGSPTEPARRAARHPAAPTSRRLLWVVLALGVAFRVFGAVVNREANDDHMEVIRVMAHERRIPSPTEFWESFQPPLYHLTVAGTLMALPPLSSDREIQVAQAFSCAAGVLTLVLVAGFLRARELPGPVTTLGVALASLSPALISTSIQATNDAFVILFVTMALVAGYRFFEAFDRRSFATMTAAALMACTTKGHGLVVALAVLLAFGAALWAGPSRRRTARWLAVYVLLVALVVPWAGGYLARRAATGSAFTTNMQIAPPPDVLRLSAERRPGIRSIVDGFLTFRLGSLLAHPLIEVEMKDADPPYPLHRTSLWSLIYGGANSAHYAYYPKSWRVRQALAETLVRATALAGLLPALALVLGLVTGTWRVVRDGLGRPTGRWASEACLVIAAVGYLAFVAVYGYRYRDFSTMKAIFVSPATVVFLLWFARTLAQPGGPARAAAVRAVIVSGVVLCAAYIADVGVLLTHLAVGDT